ncbi:MAG: hypothetical protein HYX56_03810 [Chloroflexi bacterium]|nr:hypothetical protein [Chloroflexota bacterium]
MKFFGSDLEGEDSPQLKVTNRSGKKVAVHCHPSQGLWPQALSRLIRDLEITRDEFWEWSNAGRKAR